MSTTGPEQYVARLRATIAGLERDLRQADQALAERRAVRADDARAGRLGPDWQAVQRRIDGGQTSLADVFAGRDGTPAARRLLQVSQQQLDQLAADPPVEVQQELVEADAQWADLARETRPDGTP